MPRIFRRKKTSTKSKSSRRRISRPKGAFKKKVLSVIHSQVENKEVILENPGTYFNSGINASADVSRIVPLITQGIDDGQRVGSEVRAQKLNLRGYLVMSQASTTGSASRIGVRMMVVTPKRYMHTTDAVANATTWLPKLLKIGGTERPFDGYPQDLFSPLNSDVVTKHYDKVMYMTVPYIATNIGAIPVNQNSTKFFNIRLKCKNKKLTYDETSNYPFGYGPVLIIGYAHLDGASPDTVTTQILGVWNSILQYEDA